MNREMAGTYQCLANNGIEEPAVAGVNLHVNCKTEHAFKLQFDGDLSSLLPSTNPDIPEVHSPAKSVHTKIGYRATLECFVLASPSGTVQWYHHGVPVIMDNHIARSDVDVVGAFLQNYLLTTIEYYLILQSPFCTLSFITHQGTEPSLYAGVETKNSLIIRSVRDRDMGMYECRAENELGSKGVLINLSGMPKQSIFKSSPIRSIGRTFNLLWQTESYSPISEYRLKFRPESRRRKVVDDWREITIPAEFSDAPIHTAAYSLPGLDIGIVYEVAVMSRNRYGWSEMSKVYRFAIGGEGQWQWFFWFYVYVVLLQFD